MTSSFARPDQRLVNARDAIFYWNRFLEDVTIPHNKRYFEMKRGYNAFIVVTALLRGGRRSQALGELWRYWSRGASFARASSSPHLVYARVQVRRYADGTIAIYYGPRCIERYHPDGTPLPLASKGA